MTQQHIYRDLADAVRAIKTEYNHDVDAIARALVDARGAFMCLFFIAAIGWGVLIFKCFWTFE